MFYIFTTRTYVTWWFTKGHGYEAMLLETIQESFTVDGWTRSLTKQFFCLHIVRVILSTWNDINGHFIIVLFIGTFYSPPWFSCQVTELLWDIFSSTSVLNKKSFRKIFSVLKISHELFQNVSKKQLDETGFMRCSDLSWKCVISFQCYVEWELRDITLFSD